MIDQRHAVRAHALVVEPIEAVELDAVERHDLRIVVDAEPVGRDVLADVARERLAARRVLLAMALDAVAEHLVEEHARGAALEDRRADVRLGERRVVQRVEIGGDRRDHLVDLGVAGQVGRRAAEPLLEPRQVHAVVGLDADGDRELRVRPRLLDLAALAVDEVARC